MVVTKKENTWRCRSSSNVGGVRALFGWLLDDDGVVLWERRALYPSHFRPVFTQRLQLGFASSHLIFRILLSYQPQIIQFILVTSYYLVNGTYLHVLHPVFTLSLPPSRSSIGCPTKPNREFRA